MTPQLVPQPPAAHGEAHLTGEQFGELLARFTEAAGTEPTPAEVHLQACEACATELASLREVIALYREASKAYAEEDCVAYRDGGFRSGACSRIGLCRRTGLPPPPCF